MKIGFIGLGIMGSRMAANLQAQGYELVVFNRSTEKAKFLCAKGATLAPNAAEVGAQTDVLLTMLAHPPAVTEMALGDNGFLSALKPGSLWIDCSTVNPQFSRQMAAAALEKQIRFLDAPVAGSKNQAQQGKLVFFVGGERQDLSTCQPLLASMGKKVVFVGGSGMGTSLKMTINLLLGTSMAAFAEALVLGKNLGISSEILWQVLLASPVVAPFIALKQENLEQGEYKPEFPLQWMEKDLHLVINAANDLGVALPLTNITQELYQQAVVRGLGTADFSAIYSSIDT